MTRDQCKWYWKGFDDAKAKLEQRSANEHGEPVAWGFQNSAITGSNRWMMLREEIPANDQYGGALWTPLYTIPYVATPRPQRIAAEGEDTRRAWEGLSVFEINDLVTNTEHGLHELVERTEKLLKEKNT